MYVCMYVQTTFHLLAWLTYFVCLPASALIAKAFRYETNFHFDKYSLPIYLCAYVLLLHGRICSMYCVQFEFMPDISSQVLLSCLYLLLVLFRCMTSFCSRLTLHNFEYFSSTSLHAFNLAQCTEFTSLSVNRLIGERQVV